MSKHKARQSFRIIEAAMGLIKKEGMSRINISKVADAAGITRQTVYNHFPDVESIISKALDLHGRAMLEHLRVEMDKAEGAGAKLHAFAAFQIGSASTEHETASLEAGLSANSREMIASYDRAVFDMLTKVIKTGLKDCDFNADTDLEILTNLVQGVIKGGVVSVLRRPAQKGEILEATNTALRAILAEP